MNHRERIGQQIAELRKSKGLTLKQLAEISGITFQNITKIEHGRYNVSIDILAKLCDALGVSIEIAKTKKGTD